MRKIFTLLTAALMSVSMFAVDGMLSGYFSVSATKTVAFSKGNLQASTTDLGTNWTWSFAEHQWDVVGDAVANTKIDGDGKVSENGTIDLFGWSTPSTYFGINNSQDNATFSGDFKDWGDNPISNGGNAVNIWYTMPYAEWAYLLVTRTNAADKKGQAVANGINGLVLLPDDWTMPDGLTFTPSPGNFTTNVYTTEQWKKMEDNGAVFLPYAGRRYYYSTVDQVGAYGVYLVATEMFDYMCFRVFFSETIIDEYDGADRYVGESVRLVHTAQVGDIFKAASGSDILQYEVTEVTPDRKVRVTQSGHKFQDQTDLIIPASVNYMGQTFAVTGIANYPVFYNAKTISLPNSLTAEVNWWSGALGSLEEWIVADDNPIYRAVDGILYNADTTVLVRCPAKKVFTSADFPTRETNLDAYAFYDCTGLSDLVIPRNIHFAGKHSIFMSSSITSVFLPSSIVTLSNGVFRSCENLTSVTFEKSASVNLSWDAFLGSKILTDQGDMRVIDSVAVEYIGTADTVAIPDSVVNVVYSFIGAKDAAASNLTTVILPSTIKKVDREFLSFNSASEKFPNLERIICKAQDVPTVGSGLKLNSAKDVTLVVPCGKKAEYTAATSFSDPFANIEEDCTITEVNVTVVCPNVGDDIKAAAIQPSDPLWNVTGNVSIPDNVNYEIRYYSVYQENGQWPTESKILPNTTYKMGVSIWPSAGYTWPMDGTHADLSKMTITLNGVAPEGIGFGTSNTIELYKTFTTSATGIENGEVLNGANGVQKFLRDGQLIILRGDRTYTLTGQEVR